MKLFKSVSNMRRLRAAVLATGFAVLTALAVPLTAAGVATRYGDQIVTLVSETVKRWDATTITGRIENAVGRDLQFIRINGTLVGGLVGMTLHFIVSFL